MDKLETYGIAVSRRDGSVTFLLDDETLLSGTGFKVLMASGSPGLLSCARSRMNGKVKLTYFTPGLRPLADIVDEMSPQHLLAVLTDLVGVVTRTRDNGFLSLRSLLLDPRFVFVVSGSCEVRLLCLPLDVPADGGEARAHERLCGIIAELAARVAGPATVLSAVRAYADAGTGDLDALSDVLRTGSAKPGAATRTEEGCGGTGFSLRAATSPPLEIAVPSGRTILGKSRRRADIALDVSTAVSRVHCALEARDGALYVADMGSANGTFINGVRLPQGSPVELRAGDSLRLADVSFSVVGGGSTR